MVFSAVSILLTAVVFAQNDPLPSIVDEYIADFHNDFDVRAENRNNYRPLLANVVRLAFHSCVGAGGCDGCINMNQPDNAGLELSVDYLETKTEAWLASGLSKADLYALASMVAANMALGDAGWESDLSDFEIGRTDCTEPDEEDAFPDAHQSPFQFFDDNFGFDARDTTVILGAHTLGQAQVGNSGFTNFWVDNPLDLGNDFYRAIERNPWDQIQVGTQFQWDQNGLMALNADMFLVRDLNPAADGRELDCPNNFNRCDDAATLDIVEDFASPQGEAQFQEEFKDVYVRMLQSAGSGFTQDLQLICDVYDCNAEEPVATEPVTIADDGEDADPEEPVSTEPIVSISSDDENVDDVSISNESTEPEAPVTTEIVVSIPEDEDDVENVSSDSDESDDQAEATPGPVETNTSIPPPPQNGRGRRDNSSDDSSESDESDAEDEATSGPVETETSVPPPGQNDGNRDGGRGRGRDGRGRRRDSSSDNSSSESEESDDEAEATSGPVETETSIPPPLL